MFNCIVAGVGGQGTVLASKLIAQSGMSKGFDVRTAETIGMAQRGGCVVSHVRIGKEIFSPIIPLKSADLLIGFEPAEAVRNLKYLKKDAAIIVSKKAIMPIAVSGTKDYKGEDMIKFLRNNVKNLIVIDGEAACKKCGSSKVLNMVLLGAAVSSGVMPFSMEDMENTVKSRVKQQFVEMNLQALNLGAKSALEVK